MKHSYIIILGTLFAALWLGLAISPIDRTTWLLENVLVLAAVALLAATYRRFPLSKISYTFIFLFMCLHLIGAHFTYSETPYDRWGESILGFSIDELFGWERNNFDRVIHFSYGLLLVYPMREAFLRIADVKGFWGYFLPLDLTMSTSMIYELVEWAAAVYFGDGSSGFLGTQGDSWDAHKDMALATLGGLIGMGGVMAINAVTQRDFSRDFIASLKVKDPRPLGEVALSERMSD